MAGSSSNTSQNLASSKSTSQSATNVIDASGLPYAQFAGLVGQDVYNWARQAYAKNSSLTDATIHNDLMASGNALGQANAYQNEYNNRITPEANQLIDDANQYASPDRIAERMGAAESGQQQGTEAALANHTRELQSYGIDPSAGRYAGLDEAARVSGAASAVGAAQQAREDVLTRGQNLRQQALQFGETLPGATTNAMNTGLQGFAGAQFAGNSNEQTGVALQGAAGPYLGTAAGYHPTTGTNSSSSSTSNSSGTSTGSSVSIDPQQQSGANKDKANASNPPPAVNAGGGGGGGSGPGSPGQQIGGPSGATDGSGGDVFSTGTSPFNGGYGGDNGVGGGQYSTDPFTSAYPADGVGYAPAMGMDPSAASISDYSNGNFGAIPDYSSTYGSAGGPDYASYAQGGAIDDGDDTGGIPTDGGQIPASASPSGGQQVDDVQAQGPHGAINVNADEFVIPRDVALWKGQEFFQKLIAQSRQARVTAPAKPTQGPPAQGMR